MVSNVIQYTPKVRTALIGNKEYTVRNLEPVYSNTDEQKVAERRIENGLFNIFKKYMS